MSSRLPLIIDPLAQVAKRRAYKGSLAISEFSRLQDSLLDSEGYAKVELAFRKDGKISAVLGCVSAVLTLQCQICMESMSWPVESDITLGVVASIEEAERLPEPYEPLLIENRELCFSDIIEDELLLALPAIPKHPGCLLETDTQRKTENSERPFAALAELIKTGDT